MSYNTNTRLLLNFNGSDGATTTTDTSQAPFAVTLSGSAHIESTQGKFSSNSLELGDPYGSGSAGIVSVNSPSSLFSTSRSSAKRLDLWAYREANSPWGTAPFLSITFANADTLVLWRGATGYELEINSLNFDGSYNYTSATDYNGYQTWVHVRLVLYGDTAYLGIDGAQVATLTDANNNDLWIGDAGNPITEVRIGVWPSQFGNDSNAYHRGYLDCYELTEGDTSWLGGTYAVPSAPPDDYVGGGVTLYGTGSNTTTVSSVGDGVVQAVRTGTGASTVDAIVSVGAGNLLPVISGSCANTLDSLVNTGYGNVLNEILGVSATTVDTTSSGTGIILPVISGSGANSTTLTSSGAGEVLFTLTGSNTVEEFTSSGIGGSPDGYKTLVLHGNTSPGVSVDSSIYNNTLTNSGVTTSTIAPYMGSSAMSFSGTPGADSLTVPVGNGLFEVPGSDKIFDFHIRPSVSDSGVKRVFRIDFPENYIYSSNPSYVSVELDYDSGPSVKFKCYTPSIQAATTLYYSYNTEFTLRISFVGNKVYVGMDGVQQYSKTSDTLGPVWPQGGLPTSFIFGGSTVGFSGQIDEFLITEAPLEFHGYNGGNYSTDTTEWATGQIRGRGANTLDALTSIGTGFPGDARTGTGANTLEAVVSTGNGYITAVVYGDSSVTLDDTSNEGNVNVGVFREAFGANTSEDFTSTGGGTISPLIYCDGASTTESVTSDGAGLLSWNGRGANTLESITSTGDGAVASSTSVGANTVDAVTSSGSGTVAIVGVGASVTETTSQGNGTTAAYGQGASTTLVTSMGAGYVDKSCLGANTTSVISLGAGLVYTAGSGGNIVGHISSGNGSVLISGAGSSTTEIYTFSGHVPVSGEEDADRVDIVLAHFSAVAKTRQNVACVRLA